jgi:hypothetical protein
LGTRLAIAAVTPCNTLFPGGTSLALDSGRAGVTALAARALLADGAGGTRSTFVASVALRALRTNFTSQPWLTLRADIATLALRSDGPLLTGGTLRTSFAAWAGGAGFTLRA